MLTFSKMHGIGNDYIYINCFQETVTDPEKLSIFMSNVRFGARSAAQTLLLIQQQRKKVNNRIITVNFRFCRQRYTNS